MRKPKRTFGTLMRKKPLRISSKLIRGVRSGITKRLKRHKLGKKIIEMGTGDKGTAKRLHSTSILPI